MRIIPTIISKNQKEFDEYFNRIKKHTKWIQIDIMDGKFVKNKSNWFNLKLKKFIPQDPNPRNQHHPGIRPLLRAYPHPFFSSFFWFYLLTF